MRMGVRSLASLSGLRTQGHRELWRRSQMWLRSRITVSVAQAGSYSSNAAPSLGTSKCHTGSSKKKKKKGFSGHSFFFLKIRDKIPMWKMLRYTNGPNVQQGTLQRIILYYILENLLRVDLKCSYHEKRIGIYVMGQRY